MHSLDIVIPVYNEQDCLPELFQRLHKTFLENPTLQTELNPVRFLFVDDGSQDGSHALIKNFKASGAPVVLLRLSRNFGHQAAVAAGIHHADADTVACIDADLQDPPEIIPEMLERWKAGYHVVLGQRRNRTEGPLKRFGYWGFYRLLSMLSPFQIPADVGDFCLMDRQVVNALRKLPESIRFSRVLRAWVGFRQTTIVYDRPARIKGRSNYKIIDLYHLATEGLVSASTRPLIIIQGYSFFLGCLFSALFLFFLSRLFSFVRGSLESEIHLLIVLSSFVASGMFFTLYVIIAYLSRTYQEVKARPPYVMLETKEEEVFTNGPRTISESKYQSASSFNLLNPISVET